LFWILVEVHINFLFLSNLALLILKLLHFNNLRILFNISILIALGYKLCLVLYGIIICNHLFSWNIVNFFDWNILNDWTFKRHVLNPTIWSLLLGLRNIRWLDLSTRILLILHIEALWLILKSRLTRVW